MSLPDARVYTPSMDSFSVFVLALSWTLIAYLAWLGLSKRGKAIRARNIARNKEKRKLVSEGKYRTSSKEASGLLVGGILLFVALSMVVAAFLELIAPLYSQNAWFSIMLGVGLVVGSIFSAIASVIAKQAEEKGRRYETFFFLSVLFSPIIMGIIAAAIQPLNKSAVQERQA